MRQCVTFPKRLGGPSVNFRKVFCAMSTNRNTSRTIFRKNLQICTENEDKKYNTSTMTYLMKFTPLHFETTGTPSTVFNTVLDKTVCG